MIPFSFNHLFALATAFLCASSGVLVYTVVSGPSMGKPIQAKETSYCFLGVASLIKDFSSFSILAAAFSGVMFGYCTVADESVSDSFMFNVLSG